MTALITSLEAAERGSREWDAEIALLDGWTLQKMKGDRDAYWRKPGATEYWDRVKNGPPQYTTSLDASLALTERLLPEWRWQIWRDACRVAVVIPPSLEWVAPFYRGTGATPALALVIATLKAWGGGEVTQETVEQILGRKTDGQLHEAIRRGREQLNVIDTLEATEDMMGGPFRARKSYEVWSNADYAYRRRMLESAMSDTTAEINRRALRAVEAG